MSDGEDEVMHDRLSRAWTHLDNEKLILTARLVRVQILMTNIFLYDICRNRTSRCL